MFSSTSTWLKSKSDLQHERVPIAFGIQAPVNADQGGGKNQIKQRSAQSSLASDQCTMAVSLDFEETGEQHHYCYDTLGEKAAAGHFPLGG
ncbi:hypothetical protein N7456_012589 [Penicillium angulare]|uniref:Uncharacterized protein n=1 Tax=Penicillium angulare TaxID=116970 RepID=A0A9W9JVZ8_9EURO|nr:hypothetical protein N7456_012589 [Penicillium angulare]